jgi:hypothetical protein
MLNPYRYLKQSLCGSEKFTDVLVSLCHAAITFTLANLYESEPSVFPIFALNSMLYFYFDIDKYSYPDPLYIHHVVSTLCMMLGQVNVGHATCDLLVKGVKYAELSNFALLSAQAVFASPFSTYTEPFKFFIVLVETAIYGYFRVIMLLRVMVAVWEHGDVLMVAMGGTLYLGGVAWTGLLLRQVVMLARKKLN